MRSKLLVDECLSVDLVRLAQECGYQATYVRDIGKLGARDHELASIIFEGDWCFVTNNAAHFRGPAASPGSAGHYAGIDLHAGLVCLHNGSPGGFTLDRQMEALLVALAEIELLPNEDTTNKLIEVTWLGDRAGGTDVVVADFPAA